jgi:hypothetical protein
VARGELLGRAGRDEVEPGIPARDERVIKAEPRAVVSAQVDAELGGVLRQRFVKLVGG